MDVLGKVCQTHKTSQTAFRGFGGPQGMVFIEEVVDRVARSLGMPPDAVRERNFYGGKREAGSGRLKEEESGRLDPSANSGQALSRAEGRKEEGGKDYQHSTLNTPSIRTQGLASLDPETYTTHYGQVIKDVERIQRIWDELKASSDYTRRREETTRFNAAHPNTKRGLAITPVKFGIAFNLTFLNQAGALVLIYQDGSVQLNHGGTEMGQGLYTKMQQVAAQALGIGLEQVRPMPTRTDKVPNTSATAASAGADLNGGAVRDACEKLKARLATVAAQQFGVSAQDVRFEAGKVWSISNPEKQLDFVEVVKKAYSQRVQLFSDGYYRTPALHWDKERMQGKPFHYFAYGASVSEVEVDRFTGQYRVRRVDILHDVGDSLSPLVDIGQVEGGFVQGMGWLTLEDLRWDARGQVATRSASTYKLPSFSELPELFRVKLLERATEEGVVYGSKAVGEPPLMLAISVREALRDAVAAFGQGGIVELASPATPEAVYWAIEKVRSKERVAAD
jgi:xanthine dehydrogenase large subunit